ncbi:MAG: GNAT family N-acetyltransferase [Thermoplasmata archaeon]|nr:GNAT family N-acetyltransferase [Thermoplasmata archaeon]
MPLPTSFRLKDGRWAIIRRAKPDDAESWLANVNSIGAEQVYIMTERLERTPEQLREQFAGADPGKELWLSAEVDGALVGGADFKRGRVAKNAHVAELGIAITKPFRGLGLGEPMMRAGIEWAKSLGLTRLRLSVFQTNWRAIALYRKLGFVEEGRLKGEVILEGEAVDELLMALSL